MILPAMLLAFTLVLENGCVATVGPPPPPAPVTEAYIPPPYPEAVWVGGGWMWHPEHHRYEWHRGEWRRRGWERGERR